MRILWSLGVLVLGACSSPGAPPLESRTEPLAQTGPWQIPDAVRAAGDAQSVPYTGAGSWPAACATSVTPEADALRAELEARFADNLSTIDDLACRPILGSTDRTSVHAVGRALDVHVPTVASGDADNDLGDPIGNWLVENAEAWSVQYVIWDEWQWQANLAPGAKDSAYGGVSPHHDHLHVEVAAADSLCPSVPTTGGVIDETSPCFQKFGPAEHWHRETGSGYDDALLWTDAWESEVPSNWARWQVRVEVSGDYLVDAYVAPDFGGFDRVRYEVGSAAATVDQTRATGFVPVGTFRFEVGSSSFVSVFDDGVAPIEPDRHIAVDALRLTPARRPRVRAVAAEAFAAPETAAGAPERPHENSCSVGRRRPGPAWLGLAAALELLAMAVRYPSRRRRRGREIAP